MFAINIYYLSQYRWDEMPRSSTVTRVLKEMLALKSMSRMQSSVKCANVFNDFLKESYDHFKDV